MAEISCPFWLQARRARSDAPYHDGHATGFFDFIAHFGVRVYRRNVVFFAVYLVGRLGESGSFAHSADGSGILALRGGDAMCRQINPGRLIVVRSDPNGGVQTGVVNMQG